MGDCITTYTGKHFDPTHPDEELIFLFYAAEMVM